MPAASFPAPPQPRVRACHLRTARPHTLASITAKAAMSLSTADLLPRAGSRRGRNSPALSMTPAPPAPEGGSGLLITRKAAPATQAARALATDWAAARRWLASA
eukprot:scaffold12360_cov109-Isochrysis_galbana.AAC.4